MSEFKEEKENHSAFPKVSFSNVRNVINCSGLLSVRMEINISIPIQAWWLVNIGQIVFLDH